MTDPGMDEEMEKLLLSVPQDHPCLEPVFVMTPEERVAAAQKKGRRCIYCHGERLVTSWSNRLNFSCTECAAFETKANIVSSLPCVICGVAVTDVFDEDKAEITHMNVDHKSMSNGMAARIAYGYGCRLDGRVYMIAVCEDCTRQAETNGRLTYCYNYIP